MAMSLEVPTPSPWWLVLCLAVLLMWLAACLILASVARHIAELALNKAEASDVPKVVHELAEVFRRLSSWLPHGRLASSVARRPSSLDEQLPRPLNGQESSGQGRES